MDEEPGGTALFPDAGVAELNINLLAVLGFFEEVHGDDGPGNVAMARDFQFFAGRKSESCGSFEKLFLNARSVFFPAVVGKRRDIIKDEVVVFGVELGGVGGIAGAPRGAVSVDEFAERGGVRGFLLGASAGKREQATEKSKHDVQDPMMAWSVHTHTRGRLHRHSSSPEEACRATRARTGVEFVELCLYVSQKRWGIQEKIFGEGADGTKGFACDGRGK